METKLLPDGTASFPLKNCETGYRIVMDIGHSHRSYWILTPYDIRQQNKKNYRYRLIRIEQSHLIMVAGRWIKRLLAIWRYEGVEMNMADYHILLVDIFLNFFNMIEDRYSLAILYVLVYCTYAEAISESSTSIRSLKIRN